MGKYLLIAIAIFSFSRASAGPGSGGGGDTYAIEFKRVAEKILETFSKDPSLSSIFPQVDLPTFREKLLSLKIETKDRLLLNGEEMDAINYPDRNLLLLSRNRWVRISQTPGHQASLAFHELLGLMGIDDTMYKVSAKFAAWQAEHNYPFEILSHKYYTAGLYTIIQTKSFEKDKRDWTGYTELFGVYCDPGDIPLLGSFTLQMEAEGQQYIYSYGIYDVREGQLLKSNLLRYGWKSFLKPADAFADGTDVTKKGGKKITYKGEVICRIQ